MVAPTRRDIVGSSGVHLATYSALLAARSINSTLAGLVPEERCFTEFETRYRREFGLFRDFLRTFYQVQAREDVYVEHARQLTVHGPGRSEDAFVDLVGGVSSSDFARDMSGDVLAEGAQLPLRGLLGAAAGDEPPMFPGGLVSSADGRRWEIPDV